MDDDLRNLEIVCRPVPTERVALEVSTDGGTTWEYHELPHGLMRLRGRRRGYVPAARERIVHGDPSCGS